MKENNICSLILLRLSKTVFRELYKDLIDKRGCCPAYTKILLEDYDKFFNSIEDDLYK